MKILITFLKNVQGVGRTFKARDLVIVETKCDLSRPYWRTARFKVDGRKQTFNQDEIKLVGKYERTLDSLAS